MKPAPAAIGSQIPLQTLGNGPVVRVVSWACFWGLVEQLSGVTLRPHHRLIWFKHRLGSSGMKTNVRDFAEGRASLTLLVAFSR